MEDKEFLQWVYGRLIMYGEKETYDYMHRLKAIIKDTPSDKTTIERFGDYDRANY